ncbi:hypothetical protein K432DRAFT_423665 [Lepidopterella palustris CBS 459.81]|uniref:Zn(2)-C6 fungal-type domain-containing protein n=1 Tax=Lepidopterella palustris CBS 459.81 TaxID=1314670 RepID=A0A8E2JIB1_9PEZI|nr:hypothetical protein K432DRAFT_423665 [Lepidopterella palustris CBS 459.81]
MTSRDEYPVRVRKRYTTHACIECQRRKRKCTGETVCKNCLHSGIECVYSQSSRPSKQPRIARPPTPNSSSGNWNAVDVERCPDISLHLESSNETINRELISRTHTLEQGYEALKRELARMKSQERGRAALQELPPPAELSGVPPSFSPASTSTIEHEPARNNVFERNTKFMGGTSFFQQIDLLDRSVARDLGKSDELMFMFSEGPGGQTMDYESLSAGMRRDLDQIVDETRLEDMDKVLQSLDIYFASVHPHYPCINEAHLRSQLAAFLANDPSCMSKTVAIQFAALLNFLMAVVRILYDTCTHDDYVPGWKEFYRAEKLLSHATWLGKANIMTIQILLVKTSYCLYISRLNAAYDTMGTAVRLCFQLGLHNEPSWGEDCNVYDRTYRQRIFWSIYCLNHNVAQNSGVPDLIRESDFDVDRPQCVDDRMLYPNCPPLREMPKASLVPYLLEVMKLAKLSSEIWDAMFGVRVKKPVSQEFIAETDGKIIELSKETPSFLRWPPASGLQSPDSMPAFIIQQSFVLYLRVRALRMLLRREEMVSLRYEKRTAQLCIEIATDVVNAVELSYSSSVPKRTERYAYALHLTGAMVPMICVIVRRNNGEDLIRPAIHIFNRSLKIMEAISYGFSFARHTLHQLRRPIRAAREIIDSNWPQYAHSALAPPPPGSNLSSAQVIMPNPTGIAQNHMWGNDGRVAMANARGEIVTEDWQRPPEDPLIWEDLDMWNNMSSWQS